MGLHSGQTCPDVRNRLLAEGWQELQLPERRQNRRRTVSAMPEQTCAEKRRVRGRECNATSAKLLPTNFMKKKKSKGLYRNHLNHIKDDCWQNGFFTGMVLAAIVLGLVFCFLVDVK